jgi:hypothetical protein
LSRTKITKNRQRSIKTILHLCLFSFVLICPDLLLQIEFNPVRIEYSQAKNMTKGIMRFLGAKKTLVHSLSKSGIMRATFIIKKLPEE